MIAAAIIPTLPVALIPAGLMPVAFGLALVAVAAGFGTLVATMLREDGAALGPAARSASVAPLAIATPLSRAA